MSDKRAISYLVSLISLLIILPSCTKKPVWDYVALGDSIAEQRNNYVVRYAANLRVDLDVQVKLDNRGIGGLTSGELLYLMQNNADLRNALSEAEVVTLVIGANDLNRPLNDPNGRGKCDGRGTEDCLQRALETFQQNYDEILGETFTLCQSGTIIRSMTYHYGILNTWGFNGDVRPYYEPLNTIILEAGSAYNIPVAQVHMEFNGPDSEENPADKGYLARDGLHTSRAGAKIIADLHRQLGYESTCP